MTSFLSAAQAILQVQPCPSTPSPVTITSLGFSTQDWSTPDLSIPSNAVSGQVVWVEDGIGDSNDGCEPLTNISAIAGKIAFINRGTCGFGFKALQAQNAGAVAVVIVNNVQGQPFDMSGGTEGWSVTIPVVMVSQANGTLPVFHPFCTFFLGTPAPVNNDMQLIYGFPGYLNTPYHQLPESQFVLNTLTFYGKIKNNGLQNQNNAQFASNSNSAIFAQSNTIANFAPGSEAIMETIGAYPILLPFAGFSQDFVFEAKSNQIDQLPYNNTINGNFTITEHIMAKDKYSAQNPDFHLTDGYTQFITVFDIFQQQKLYGFDIKVAPLQANVGKGLSILVLDNSGNVVGATNQYYITQSDIANDIFTISTDGNGIFLNPGKYYMEVYSDQVFFAASGENPANSAYLPLGGDVLTPNPNFPIPYTPVIRLNFNCQILPNLGAYTISSPNYNNPQFLNCSPGCNAEKWIIHNGSDILELYNSDNTLIQTITNPTGGTAIFNNLCAGTYKVVGKKLCYNNISDTLIFEVFERTEVELTGINTSTCITSDGSVEIELISPISINSLYGTNHSFSVSWSGLTSGSSTLSGTNTFNPSVNYTINGNFLTNSNAAGSYYTFTVVDNNSGCQTIDTITIDNNVPTQDLCVVTVDETTGNHNVIVWERPSNDSHIEEFRIYREITTNNYQQIGSVNTNDLTMYEDFTANPNATGYKYKVTLVDVCGEESDLGTFHNTIHLQYLGSGNFQWSQYAIEGEPNPVASYNIYRDDNGTGNFQILPNGVVPGSQSTYTDVNYANFPNAVYVVDVNWVNTAGCSASRVDFNTSRSNMKSTNSSGASLIENLADLMSIYPNPNAGIVNIVVPEMLIGNTLRVTNSLGQTLQTELIFAKETVIDMHNFSSGIYYLEINTTEGLILKKIIKN